MPPHISMRRAKTLVSSILVCSSLLLLPACSHIQVTGTHAESIAIRSVAERNVGGAVAPDPAGLRLAVASDGLLVTDLSTGAGQRLAADSPSQLGWSPSGRILAAAFPAGERTRLRLFDPSGSLVSETWIAGSVTGLFVLSDNEVVATGTRFETFSFGTSWQECLYRWRIGEEPVRQIMHETTLKPQTARTYGADNLSRTMRPVLSPIGDELLYGKILDPPVFAPSLRIVIRNLRQNSEKEIGSVGLDAGVPVFANNGEDVIFGDSAGQARRRAAWSGEELATLPVPGRRLAISRTGRHIVIDGHLYRDDREIAAFPPESEAAFLPDGRLLLTWEDGVYLAEGIEQIPAAPPLDPERAGQLRDIRAWRAGGLITAAEYIAARERILHP